MRQLDHHFGRAKVQQLDETGRVVTKDQEAVNRKVKEIMIKAQLIPSDKQQQEEAERFFIPPVNTVSPYKKKKKIPKIYEDPAILNNRFEGFQQKISKAATLQEQEILQMIQYIRDDQFIEDKFTQDQDFERHEGHECEV